MQGRPLPAPDHLDFTLRPGDRCLIADDGSPIAVALAQALAARGWPVTLAQLSQAPAPQPERPALPEGIAQLALETDDEPALAALEHAVGPVGCFIYLHPPFADPEPPAATAAEEKARLRAVFLLAGHLKPALNAAACGDRAAFLTVTRCDGALGLSGGDFSPLAGGLNGLTKTLAREWPAVFCRAVDLSPALPAEESARAILAELHDPDRCLLEVGISEQGRMTLVPAPTAARQPLFENHDERNAP